MISVGIRRVILVARWSSHINYSSIRNIEAARRRRGWPSHPEAKGGEFRAISVNEEKTEPKQA